MPLCARCTGIYLFFFIMLLPGFYLHPFLDLTTLFIVFFFTQGPLALDGITQQFGLRTSTNTLRFITGALSGGTLGFLFGAMMFNIWT